MRILTQTLFLWLDSRERKKRKEKRDFGIGRTFISFVLRRRNFFFARRRRFKCATKRKSRRLSLFLLPSAVIRLLILRFRLETHTGVELFRPVCPYFVVRFVRSAIAVQYSFVQSCFDDCYHAGLISQFPQLFFFAEEEGNQQTHIRTYISTCVFCVLSTFPIFIHIHIRLIFDLDASLRLEPSRVYVRPSSFYHFHILPFSSFLFFLFFRSRRYSSSIYTSFFPTFPLFHHHHHRRRHPRGRWWWCFDRVIRIILPWEGISTPSSLRTSVLSLSLLFRSFSSNLFARSAPIWTTRTRTKSELRANLIMEKRGRKLLLCFL